MSNKENELLNQIEKLKNEIKNLKDRKKYGLVWEDKPEQVVLDCQDKLPIIKEVKNKEIKTDKNKPVNILIEGDNYHSLSVLNYTHRNKIDVIYIDPPYNTGKEKEFKYNDAWVDKEDAYRHSKWLSFMSKRLSLAKKLLKKDGLVFISIDDNEQAQLKLLCDEIFGENNFIANFIIDKTAQGANQSATFKTQHEFCLLYAKNNTLQNINYEVVSELNKKKFKYKDKKGYYAVTNSFDSINSPLIKNKNRGYTVYYNKKTGNAIVKDEYDRENNKFNKYDNSLIEHGFTPIRPGIRKGVQYPWNWKQERFLKEYREELVFQKNRKGDLSIYHKNRATGTTKDVTIKRFDTRLSGNQLVTDILGEKLFDYPKSIDMMKWVLSKHENKNSIILDFFSGSGTTGHAVLDLNKEDGGSRQFILCTNNENKIAEDVCYPRISKVIKGYKDQKGKKVEGLGGNLKYYRTSFVDSEHINKTSDDSKVELAHQAGEVMALRENTLYEVEKNEWWQIFTDGKKQTAIYFQEDKSELPNLLERLPKKSKVALYIFTWGKDEYKNEFLHHENIRIHDIPEPILEVYRSLNKL